MTVHQQSNKSIVSFGNNIDLLPFSEVLLVAKDEEISREDKRVLRRTGFGGVRFFSSGVDTAKYILMKRKSSRFTYSCLVVCHEQLSDMDATTLVSLLRLHPKSAMIPLLVIMSPESDSMSSYIVPMENRKEKYYSLGVFGLLTYPLTPDEIFQISQNAYVYYDKMNMKYKALIGTLETADDSLKLRYELAEQEKINLFESTIEKFSFCSPHNMSYEEVYQKGCEKFNHKLYDHAWVYFRRAIATDSSYKAQALFSLYQLCKEWHKLGDAKIYLIQACQVYIEEGDWDKVDECVMLFSKEFARFPHPILGILTIAIKRSDVDEVAALLYVSEKYLSYEDIALSIVKGCFHFELSSAIMRALSTNVNVFTRVLELLQERKLERQIREQNIVLKKANLGKEYEISEKTYMTLDNKTNNSNDLPKGNFSENSSDYFLPENRNLDNLRNKDFFDMKDLDSSPDREQIRLGVGSKGAIESLPLVVLNENNQGSFLRDIFSVAKQAARIYKALK